MKRTNIKVVRYEDGDFWVDVVEATDYKGVEAWLTHKDYGISELMFGLPNDHPNGEHYPYFKLISIIENNLEEYEANYIERWCD